jgi:hypothetical protein
MMNDSQATATQEIRRLFSFDPSYDKKKELVIEILCVLKAYEMYLAGWSFKVRF